MNSKLKFVQKLSLAADIWQIDFVMKKLCAYLFLTGATLAWSSCAYNLHGLALDPVGPSPYVSGTSTTGTLVVFSAFDVTSQSIGDHEHRRHYSDYKILSEDGKLLQRVHNDSGTVMREATRVQLSPGKYRVAASSNGFGTVTVPVVIAANRTTMLHLEGGYSWPSDDAFSQTNSVRLPDGQIVGWRAME
jgi:hypothetical protein